MKKIIRKILREQEVDKEVDPFNDDIFTPKYMEKLMVKMDDDPDFFMGEILPSMKFTNNQEISIIYNYLTNYKRKDYYVPVHFDAEELSNFFSEDRDYDIQHYAKKYFEQDYDYDYNYDCYDFDSYYFDMIDRVNVGTMREKYLEGLDGEGTKEGFMEFVESEFGDVIGCAMADAQNSADIDYLHSDIRNGAEDYLSEFNGIISNDVDRDGNRGWKLEFNGKREIGDVVNSEMFKETLYDHVDSGYSLLSDIFNDIFSVEREGDNIYYDNVLLPEEYIYIDTDKHFRYGGAGDIDPQYFNEILSDKLSWH
tara:strand:+ start:2108 stop:3037 length:930 start_codon:yes stop_codon:yes gene_type:complete